MKTQENKAKVTRLDMSKVNGYPTVVHWTLYVENQFIADTSVPDMARLYEKIAHVWNRSIESDEIVDMGCE